MIVVIYLLRQSITLYKNLGGLEQNLGGGLEPLSPIASAATAFIGAMCRPCGAKNLFLDPLSKNNTIK